MAKKYVRQNGESMQDFQARCRAEQQAAGAGWQGERYAPNKRKPRAVRQARSDRNADRIDGYDRDDLGLSADY